MFGNHKKGGSLWTENTGIAEAKEFITQNNLYIMPCLGSTFTWSNNARQPQNRIYETIDHVIVNSNWFLLYDKAIKTLPRITFDHHPLVLQTHGFSPRPPRRFTYEKYYNDIKDISKIITEQWMMDNGGSPTFKIHNKLRAIKNGIREYMRAQSDISHAINSLERDSDEMQRQDMANNSWDTFHWEDLQKKIADYHNNLQQRHQIWSQRLHVNWKLLADKNTKFYHNIQLTTQSRFKNRGIINEFGELITDPKTILHIMKSHFQPHWNHESTNASILSAQNNMAQHVYPSISRYMNDMLVASPDDQEIQNIIMRMPKDKAPGNDGFTTDFFSNNWTIVKNDICDAIRYAFCHRRIPVDYPKNQECQCTKAYLSH